MTGSDSNMYAGIRRDEVFSLNRDALFVARLCDDIKALESIGMDYKDIKRTIGTFNYVKVWTRTPQWLYPKLRLPTGYRWKDGTKQNKLNMLVVDDDLWLKPITIPGTHIDDPEIGMVKDFRSVAPKDVAYYLEAPFSYAILDFYKSQGVHLGYTNPILSAVDERVQARRMLVQSILHLYRNQIDYIQ